MSRIYLSPPHMSQAERTLLLEAFDANWIAPVGPDLTSFESEFAAYQGVEHAVALSSGSAGLHLALLLHGVGPGDRVIVPTLTFAASANAVRHCGAEPVFVDCDLASWNVDPSLVAEALETEQAAGRPVRAVMTVDLYGQCVDHGPIQELCAAHEVALIEDAAEAVGARWNGIGAGSFGTVGVFSFNGNKVMTTGGGGMLVSSDAELAQRARHLATQARAPLPHYEHHEVGFNYRLSNLLAAVGRGQLQRLDAMIARRAEIRAAYRGALEGLDGVGFNPLDSRGTPNHWLTVATLGPHARTDPAGLIAALEQVDAEARPAWKPMHQQPVYAQATSYGGSAADHVYATGVCLPSGSSMSDDDLERVITAAVAALS